MVVGFVLSLVFALSSGEWTHISSSSLRKVSIINSSAYASTRLYPVLAPKLGDNFACENIHNLTMQGFSKGKEELVEPVVGHLNESIEEKWSEDGFLDRLQTKLQLQIENRIRRLGVGGVREARSQHIGFPSIESALISISLLLFAVYLIKLCTKIVHAFQLRKGATEFVGFLSSSDIRQPYLMGQGRRRKRFVDLDMDTLRIADWIEEQYLTFGQNK